jgi:hypothetical protein
MTFSNGQHQKKEERTAILEANRKISDLLILHLLNYKKRLHFWSLFCEIMLVPGPNLVELRLFWCS